MRLTEWRKKAPARESMDAQVMAVLGTVLADMGADADPQCLVAWGEDSALRYSILVPVTAGLVAIAVRTPAGAGEAKANARLIRWPKLAIGEFAVEADVEHRITAVQVESFVLKGVDDEADLICEFVRGLVVQADDRATQPVTADLVKALTASLGRVAVPVAAARSGAAAPRGTARVAVAAAPRGASGRSRARELPEELALKPAAARAPARRRAVATAGAPSPVPSEPPTEPAPETVAESVEPSTETGLVVLAIPTEAPFEAPAQAAADPAPDPVPAPAPRKPRAPRKPAATGEAADPKPKRPRRVHRDWPEPSAGEPGWAGEHQTGDAANKNKPQRWMP